MRLAAQEVLAACGGEPKGVPPTLPMRVVHDSRQVEQGDLFVALPGERTHGADHAGQAIAQGAAALLLPLDRGPFSRWTVRVPDTREAYGRLAAHARRRWGGRVTAITGSIGKSTIKELTAAALGEPESVGRSPASYNNEVGLPWTILNAQGTERHLVLEMGARKPGDLAYLERIAAPDQAIYAPIADSHGEHLGGPEGVLREKASLVAGWRPPRTVVLAQGDAAHSQVAAGLAGAPVARWGQGGELWAEEMTGDAWGRPSFVVANADGERVPLALRLSGAFQANNALAALAAAAAEGVPLAAAAARLAEVAPLPHRKVIHSLANDGLLLDDAYNAGLASTRAALTWAAGLAQGRPLALVLGDLKETGGDEEESHQSLGLEATKLGFQRLLATGPLASLACRAASLAGEACATARDLAERLERWDWRGWVVLVKGSRANRLERVADALLAGWGA